MPSDAYLSALNSRVNDDQVIGFMHFAHADLDPADWPDGIRVCDYKNDLTVGGIDYIAWAFRSRRPDNRADRLPQVPIEIDNVDRRIMKAILGLTSPAVATMWTAMESSPEVIEEGPMVFDLQRVTEDRNTIQGILGFEPMLWMKYGRYTFSPKYAKGVFRS